MKMQWRLHFVLCSICRALPKQFRHLHIILRAADAQGLLIDSAEELSEDAKARIARHLDQERSQDFTD